MMQEEQGNTSGPVPLQRSSTAIKVVVFDLGGVVLGSPFEAIADYEKENNIPNGFINICIKLNGEKSAFSRFEKGLLTAEQFYVEFKVELEHPAQLVAYQNYLQVQSKEVNKSKSQLVEKRQVRVDVRVLFSKMTQKSTEVDRDFLHCLGVLRGRGYQVAALTNNFQTGSTQYDVEFTSLISMLFDHVIESSKVKLRKPDPRIYRLLCNQMEVGPEEVVFLDDIGMNLSSARKLGMKTIKVELGNKVRALQELATILQLPEAVSLYPRRDVCRKPTTLFYPVGFKGSQIVVDCFGRFDDPLVIFLHGGGQTRHSWKPTASTLAEQGFCCLTVDLKGHGDSYWHTEQLHNSRSKHPDASFADGDSEVGLLNKYYPMTLSHDLDRLVKYLKLGEGSRRTFFLVGASLGGTTIMESRSKLFARGLIFVDISSKIELKGASRVIQWMKSTNEKGFSSVDEVLQAIKLYNPHRKNNDDEAEARRVSLTKNLRYRRGRYYWHWDPSFTDGFENPTQARADTREELINTKLSMLNGRNVDAMLVRGRMTDVVSLEGVKSMQNAIKRFEFVDIKGAGHMVSGDQNDIFSKKIIEFCQRLRKKVPEVAFHRARSGASHSKL